MELLNRGKQAHLRDYAEPIPLNFVPVRGHNLDDSASNCGSQQENHNILYSRFKLVTCCFKIGHLPVENRGSTRRYTLQDHPRQQNAVSNCAQDPWTRCADILTCEPDGCNDRSRDHQGGRESVLSSSLLLLACDGSAHLAHGSRVGE